MTETRASRSTHATSSSPTAPKALPWVTPVLRRAALLALLAAGAVLLSYRLHYLRFLAARGDHLLALVVSQSQLIESVVHHEREAVAPGDRIAVERTLTQIEEALVGRLHWMSPSGELVIAEAKDDHLSFHLRVGPQGDLPKETLQLPAGWAGPALRALAGQTGVGVGRDYAGRWCLAAHAPLPTLGLGLVIKEDLAELRAPLVYQAGGLALLSFLLVGSLGVRILRHWADTVRRLEDRELRLQLAHEVGGVVTFRWDLDARRILIDAAGARLLGLDPNQPDGGAAVDDWIDELVHSGDRPRLLQLLENTGVETLRPLECRMRFSEGGWRWVALRGRVTLAEGRSELAGTLVEIDAAYRGRAAALRDRRVLDGVREVLETLAEEADPLEVAPRIVRAALEVTDFHGGALLVPDPHVPDRAHLRGFLEHPETDPPSTQILEDHLPFRKLPEPLRDLPACREPATLDGLALCLACEGAACGKERWPRALLLPVQRGERTTAALLLLGVHAQPEEDRDVDEVHGDLSPLLRAVSQVLLAAETRAQAEAARRRAVLLEAAVDNLEEVVVVTDPHGVIVEANPAASTASGHSLEDLIGTEWVRLARDETPPEVLRARLERLEKGQSWTGRLTFRRPDGTTWVGETTTSPVYQDGELTHHVKVIRDLTRQLEFERELRQAQRMDAVASLTAGIAHEFNNMLGIMTGYTELTRDELRPDQEEQREDLDRVLATCERGAGLVSQLLTFSRQKEGKPVRFDPVPLAKETARLMQDASSARIGFRVEVIGEVPPVLADPAQLRQALVNLCNNAAQAYVEASGTVRLIVGVEEGRVRLAVQDEGCGIPEAILPRVTEPFYTTHQDEGRAGLGLSVVHGVVADAGGELRILSQQGAGTTAEIFLPPAPPETVSRPHPSPRRSSPARGRVLLVDDEPGLLETVARRLDRLGLEVERFADSDAALRRLDEEDAAFDLLLTDLTMPGADGRAVARRFRDACPDASRVLVTGFDALADDAGEGGALFDHILQKPVRRAELEALVEAVFEPEGA